MKPGLLYFFFSLPLFIAAQNGDTTVPVSKKVITLKEVIVRKGLNISNLIERMEKDTSFYKAFKNLKILGFTALNDIRMLDKDGREQASLQSRTRQSVSNDCRTMQVLEEHTTGDIYNADKNWNYYTAELYAGLFMVKGTRCGEDNVVGDVTLNVKGKSGMDKHREQLKMLFFNPGKKIPGIPFVGDKLAVFDDDMAAYYDYTIDMADRDGQNCYVFVVKARDNLTGREKDRIVINEMTTWFNSSTMEIVGRNYDLSYNAGVYDFDVRMEVQMTKVGEWVVPHLIRYTGNWHALFKKRERGIFTATLFDFNQGSRH
ncbi:MAG TPA: hypothetical protein VJ647_02840 [Chitinophagaceae bacterium]|nr:hypothetical protein [Chitinophagaceae bacterium]